MIKKRTSQKSWMDKQHVERVIRALKRTEGVNTRRFILSYNKNVPNWKTSGHDGIHGYWLKRFIPIHNRRAIKIKRRLQETDIPECLIKGKTTLIQKDSQKGNRPKQLQTHYMPPYYLKNTNGTSQGEIYNSLISCELIPRRIERMLQGNQRNISTTLQWSTHPQGKKNGA